MARDYVHQHHCHQTIDGILFHYLYHFVSIIIANIFVGLLLANVDELQEKQIHDEISHRSIKSKSFEKFAKNKQELLKYRIENCQDQEEVLQEQLVHIQDILERQSMIRQQRNMANLNAMQ